jgi:hypothetical protein
VTLTLGLPRGATVVAVVWGPDRLLVSLIDGAGALRDVDLLRGRPWLAALARVLAPVLRVRVAGGRLRWRLRPAGVLFTLDAALQALRRTFRPPMPTAGVRAAAPLLPPGAAT